jgi:hypothetical protein
MLETIIISIDPGETSGFCLYDEGENAIFDWGVVSDSRMPFLLEEFLIKWRTSLVIVEKWALFGSVAQTLTGDEMLTSQCIGAIKHVCSRHEVDFYESDPMKKRPFPDKTLRRMNIYTTPIHTRDAIRHLLSFLGQHKGVNPKTVEIRKDI